MWRKIEIPYSVSAKVEVVRKEENMLLVMYYNSERAMSSYY